MKPIYITVFCAASFILAIIFASSSGQPFSRFESLIAGLVLVCIAYLGRIAFDISKIAKSLEKNAADKSSQTTDEQGKK